MLAKLSDSVYWLHGNIEEFDSIALCSIMQQAREEYKPVTLLITSPGGIFCEQMLAEVFLTPCTTHVVTHAGGVAALIALAGTNRTCTPNSVYQFFEPEFGSDEELLEINGEVFAGTTRSAVAAYHNIVANRLNRDKGYSPDLFIQSSKAMLQIQANDKDTIFKSLPSIVHKVKHHLASGLGLEGEDAEKYNDMVEYMSGKGL